MALPKRYFAPDETPHIQLPDDPKSEEALIGSILHNPELLHELHDVTDKWFSTPANVVLFHALRDMYNAKVTIDFISLTGWLTDRKNIALVGGAEYITGCQLSVPTWTNYEYYKNRLHFKMAQRLSITGHTSAIEECRSALDLQEIYDCETRLHTEVTKACEKKETVDQNTKAILEFVNEVEDAQNGKKSSDFISTPFTALNKESGGLCRGELLTITGVDSSGKSLLGNQLICASALDKGEKTAIFTMEMPAKQCIRRLTSFVGNISLKSLREGKMNKGEYVRFMPALDRIQKARIDIFDTKRCSMSPEAIEAGIRRLSRNEGLSTVMIDYLQLIRIKRRKEVRHDQALGEISAMLKGLAVELNIRVILIASENNEGNVRDSGNIAYDTDCLIRMKCDASKILESVFIGKWREAKRGWPIPVELQGEFCRVVEQNE